MSPIKAAMEAVAKARESTRRTIAGTVQTLTRTEAQRAVLVEAPTMEQALVALEAAKAAMAKRRT